MDHTDSPRSLLIKALGEVCKASVHLEKLDRERQLAQRLLNSAQESYRRLMEDAPSALLLVDPQGNIVGSNKASRDLLGYSQEELVAMNLQQLYAGNGSTELNSSLRHILDEGAGSMRGLSAFRKDGQGVLLDTLFIVVTHEDRSMVQVTLNRTTERLKTQANEEGYVDRLESVLRATTSLLHAASIGSLYRAIGEQVRVLAGDVYVMVSSFREDVNAFSVQAISGPGKESEKILGRLLRHLVGVSFQISQREFQQYVTTCTPTSVSDGLSRLFLEKLPRDVYDAMQDFSLFGTTYAAGLVSGAHVFGMVNILMPKGASLDHTELVATLIENASHILRLRAREHGEPRIERPETLVEDFQNVLLEELPLPLEPEELLLHEESEHPTEEATKKTVEEQTIHAVKGREKQTAREQPTGSPKEPARESQTELDYRRLRHLFGYRKILVIDGEEIIRDVTGGLLSYMGCRVGFAANGQDGIAQYQHALDSGEPYDAVILDLSLSGDPNAEETYRKLKQLDSRARVVGSTTDASDAVMKEMFNFGFRAVLSRPYQADQLAEALQKALYDIDSLHK